MAKTKIHLLEYVERSFLFPICRVRCSCGVEHEEATRELCEEWHAGHVKTEDEKAKRGTRAQTA